MCHSVWQHPGAYRDQMIQQARTLCEYMARQVHPLVPLRSVVVCLCLPEQLTRTAVTIVSVSAIYLAQILLYMD